MSGARRLPERPRLLIDACVLYPTVMREVILGAAAERLFEPRWSPRILEEWARAAARLGPAGEAVARGEIAALSARWPEAAVTPTEAQERRLWLPDPADIHVLAAAVTAHADAIVTVNAKDFPKNLLEEEGLTRLDPDGWLAGLALAHPQEMTSVVQAVLEEARRLSGEDWTLRALMKKARLPRLGKTVERLAG
ncbi:RSP_2648 family PIN domain-containing protein [Pseudoroseicyclus aestuarii]|uniref:PIN domain-containing protein n=1 Tax=Pseudoroseicyclus aestuarii TaxID=1795041 RepID=A0A318SUP5_9RHOB|nr:PIN domain-containing protein [Pseudoroseicyclus aestuarii]PYE83976.1 PIN domain-containing protein [Pseudoroseicyclus aestuarii]